MCGYFAARAALRAEFQQKLPALEPDQKSTGRGRAGKVRGDLA
jgi:hypothetical protein